MHGALISLIVFLSVMSAVGANAQDGPPSCTRLDEQNSVCQLSADADQSVSGRWIRDSHRIRIAFPGPASDVTISIENQSDFSGTLIVGLGDGRDSFAAARTIVNAGTVGTITRCGLSGSQHWLTLFGLRREPTDYTVTVSAQGEGCATPNVATASAQATATRTADPIVVQPPRPVRRPAPPAATEQEASVAAVGAVAAQPSASGEVSRPAATAVPVVASVAAVATNQPAREAPPVSTEGNGQATAVTALGNADGDQSRGATGETVNLTEGHAGDAPDPSDTAAHPDLVPIRVVNFSPRQRVIEVRDVVCDRIVATLPAFPWDLNTVEVCVDEAGLASIQAREEDGDWQEFPSLRRHEIVRF